MKHYTVQFYSDVTNKWNNQIDAMGVNISFAKGFCLGIKNYYPCPKMRIIDNEKNIIREYYPNSNVTVD